MKISHLAAILTENDSGSKIYVEVKVKAFEQISFESSLIQ
ncbi:MAG: hypothetical protein RI883_1753 [Bacteroidota bacterium]|jgi:5,10-methylene-tetrahydrofolate dehydrogenase/methenyl tetrahydrofolate cyclohydrolase